MRPSRLMSMWCGFGTKDHPHRRIIVRKDGAPAKLAQACGQIPIGDPHAEIRLQGAEAEIEQDGAASSGRSASWLGADFREYLAAVHRAILPRQAQRDTLGPARFG